MSTFYASCQVEVGFGGINHIADLIAAIGGSKVFVVMDAFLTKVPLNLHKKVERLLRDAHMGFNLFSELNGEPTTDNLDAALKQFNGSQCDCIVAIGGGSTIDLAKAVSLFASYPQMKWDEIGKQPRLDCIPLLACPTTSGTGSEGTKVAVITNTETNVKMNPGHPDLIPKIAILDPELTLSLPPDITAFTGMDALTHAMEAYVSNRATKMTDTFALEAIRIISAALPRVFEDGSDREARQGMALASYYGGIAFSNASINLAHAAGRPLGAHFHIPHGLSVGLLLPFVMRFGIEEATERYADVALALGATLINDGKELAETAVKIVDGYCDRFDLWAAAKKYIRDRQSLVQAIPQMARDAMSGNGIATNRKVPTNQDVVNIYQLLGEKLF